jgi:hypothetical protein
MSNKELIEINKELIIQELYEWAETFHPNNVIYNTLLEEEENNLLNSYQYVCNLADRLANQQCTSSDYDDIHFHIQQINYNDVKIQL